MAPVQGEIDEESLMDATFYTSSSRETLPPLLRADKGVQCDTTVAVNNGRCNWGLSRSEPALFAMETNLAGNRSGTPWTVHEHPRLLGGDGDVRSSNNGQLKATPSPLLMGHAGIPNNGQSLKASSPFPLSRLTGLSNNGQSKASSPPLLTAHAGLPDNGQLLKKSPPELFILETDLAGNRPGTSDVNAGALRTVDDWLTRHPRLFGDDDLLSNVPSPSLCSYDQWVNDRPQQLSKMSGNDAQFLKGRLQLHSVVSNNDQLDGRPQQCSRMSSNGVHLLHDGPQQCPSMSNNGHQSFCDRPRECAKMSNYDAQSFDDRPQQSSSVSNNDVQLSSEHSVTRNNDVGAPTPLLEEGVGPATKPGVQPVVTYRAATADDNNKIVSVDEGDTAIRFKPTMGGSQHATMESNCLLDAIYCADQCCGCVLS